MSDSDYFEFGVAHDRRYTLEHLWLQLLDEKGRYGKGRDVRIPTRGLRRCSSCNPSSPTGYK